MSAQLVFQPQDGPQTKFLASPADITIYGGAAGAGKSFGLLLDAARLIDVPNYNAVLFRRHINKLSLPGGLYAESNKIYPYLAGIPNKTTRRWTFPSGATVSFEGVELESDVLNFQGMQCAYLGFDELTHFSEYQFWYLWSRVRSTIGGGGRVRATCNPEPNSWVKTLILPWLEGVKASGELCWYVREDDALKEVPKGTLHSFSITFISASIYDNPALLEKDPEYLTKLMNQPLAEKMTLFYGNWDSVDNADWFKPEHWKTFYSLPDDITWVRFWDMASTEAKKGKDPDYTVGTLMGKSSDGLYFIADVRRFREEPAKTEALIKETALNDGKEIAVRMEIEGGSSGKITIDHYARNVLSGYDFQGIRSSTSKQNRIKPFCSSVSNGLVYLPDSAAWKQPFINECARFPNKKVHDDQPDSAASAHNYLSSAKPFSFESFSFTADFNEF